MTDEGRGKGGREAACKSDEPCEKSSAPASHGKEGRRESPFEPLRAKGEKTGLGRHGRYEV